jgi:hypothetical protein
MFTNILEKCAPSIFKVRDPEDGKMEVLWYTSTMYFKV